jgi:hypothetical protein
MLEEVTQKYEAEIRKHVSIEQQMRLHIEMLEEKYL